MPSHDAVGLLREILAHAVRGGAPAELLALAAGELVDALLELEERRRGDPRRADTRRRADRTAAVVAAAGVPAACARLGLSRPTVYRHLRVSRLSRQKAGTVASNGGEPDA